MGPIVIPIAVAIGYIAGLLSHKLYDVLKNSQGNCEAKYAEPPKAIPREPTARPAESRNTSADNFDISSMESIMRKYGVDITVPNCLYILCSKIKSSTYKQLLDYIVENTNTGEDLISYINNAHIETFKFPDAPTLQGKFFIPVATIDQLLTASSIAPDDTDAKTKVELLVNAAYASAINRLKNNFGFEFGKLIKAYEEGRELQPYYNDLIQEIKISRDFLTA